MSVIPWSENDPPYITTDQMIEVDRAMIEDFGIDLVRMMENAGRSLAHLSRDRFLSGDARDRRVVVLAGTGGNGGGGLVAVRRLHGFGADVTVFVTRLEMKGVPGEQLQILDEMGVPVFANGVPDVEPDLIVDALIGYSLRGDPRGRTAELISWANDSDAPVLSLDVPSGLDPTSGVVHTPAMAATATMTLALPTAGLKDAKAVVGELYLADISVPKELYARQPLCLDVPDLFYAADVIRLA